MAAPAYQNRHGKREGDDTRREERASALGPRPDQVRVYPWTQEDREMQLRPNRTTVLGVVRRVSPEVSGGGSELVLEIVRNESTADEDYVRPEPGSQVAAFWARPEPLKVGQRVRARLKLHAGPFGQRIVAEAIEALDVASPSSPTP
jgi:hypothetical protein